MLNFILLMGPPAGGGKPGGSMGTWFFIALIAVMYIFLILPQVRKNKNQKKFLEGLQKGDKIVNIGGIHGKITKIEDRTVYMEIAPNVEITIEKSSISVDATKALDPEKWNTKKKA